jgi:cytochrome P450
MAPRNDIPAELIVDFDLLAYPEPAPIHEEYAALRGRCPIGFSERHGGHWVLTRYDDIEWVLKNPELFSSYPATIPAIEGQLQRPAIPLECDPPAHTAYRQILQPIFSPTQAKNLEPEVRRIVVELLDSLEGVDEFEVMSQLTLPLQAQVFLGLMGWPMSDAAMIHGFTDDFLLGGSSDEEVMEFRMKAAFGFYGYLAERLAERRADPSIDDVTGQLCRATYNGERPLTDDEIVDILFNLMIGGTHTTPSMIAIILSDLAQNDKLRHQIAASPTILPAAVEELLRWRSPAAASRTATRRVEHKGIAFEPGDRLMLAFGSASRDPAVFPDADKLDLSRSPNRHLAFGLGPHRCFGSHLGRMEITVALEEIHRRIPDYSLVPEKPMVAKRGQIICSVESLYLRRGVTN